MSSTDTTISDVILSKDTAVLNSTVRVQRDGADPLVGELVAWGDSQLRVLIDGKRRAFSPNSVVIYLVSAPASDGDNAVAALADATGDDATKPETKPAKVAKAAPKAEKPETKPETAPAADKPAVTRNRVVSGEGEVDVIYTYSGDKVTVAFGNKRVSGTFSEAAGKTTITVSGKDGKSGTGTTLRRACRALVKAYGMAPGAIRRGA